MRERRFAPFFWTQFLGAFTDNLYKNALILIIAFDRAASESEAGVVVGVASGLFILPFLLFSPLAGQLADKYEKSRMIRRIKLAEIAIMLLASAGLVLGDAIFSEIFLIAVLFLMGTQSAFFGPLKYSIIPQHLSEDELMHGTGLVEMGTFVAILSGTLVGGLLVLESSALLSSSLVLCAACGWLASRKIPLTAAANPGLTVSWNWLGCYKTLYAIAVENRSILFSILGISWFWFFGSMVLLQIPNFVKYFVHGDESVATFFLALFTLSIAIGSALTHRLSETSIELGLVPLGAIGMSVFAFDLGSIDFSGTSSAIRGFAEFVHPKADLPNYRIIFDLCALGISGSFFIVPLYALLQHRSDPETCSRVIAANNIAGALFMVVSSISVSSLYAMGLRTPDLFLVVSALNLIASLCVFLLHPEFVLRFALWVLAKTLYRLSYENRRAIPRVGPCILVSNHVSFIDWLVITAACQRPTRFVMQRKIFQIPVLSKFFELCRAIPIAAASEDSASNARARERIAERLDAGDMVCIFPEGHVTRDGRLAIFRTGIEQILEENQVAVIPIALRGLWGSLFSRVRGRAMTGLHGPRRRTIVVSIGDPLPSDTTAEVLQQKVAELLGTPMQR